MAENAPDARLPVAQVQQQAFDAPLRQGLKSPLTQARDYLEDQSKIQSQFDRHDRYRRYVDLRSQQIFNALVLIYTNFFKQNWDKFARLVDSNVRLNNLSEDGPDYAARVIISGWFFDLWVSIRESTKRVSALAFNEYFRDELDSWSTRYDPFLISLMQFLKPTNVKLTHEDTLFIPLIIHSRLPNVTEEDNFDYFNLQRWTYNISLFYGLLQVMEERRLVKMMDVPTNSVGRPFWLFDWHDDTFYAWFPLEGNYNMDDVTLAYILGTACSPALGPRDYDEWQTFPGNVYPDNIDVHQYARSRPLSYNGAVTYRSYQRRTYQISVPNPYRTAAPRAQQPPPAATQPPALPPQAPKPRRAASTSKARTTGKRKATESSSTALAEPEQSQDEEEIYIEGEITSSEPQVPALPPSSAQDTDHPEFIPGEFKQFRLIDYIYFRRLQHRSDFHSRFAAWQIVFKYDL